MSLRDIKENIEFMRDYNKHKPKDLRRKKKLWKKFQLGKVTDEEAMACVNEGLLEDIRDIECAGLRWKYDFSRAVEDYNDPNYPDFISQLKNGDESRRTLITLTAGAYALDTRVDIQQFNSYMFHNLQWYYSLGSYLQNKYRHFDKQMRDDFLDKAVHDKSFLVKWYEILTEDLRQCQMDGISQENYFEPVPEDVIRYVHFLDWLDNWVKIGICPVNKAGEFVHMDTRKPVCFGSEIFAHGIENGMPDETMTVADFPHFDYQGVIEETPLNDIKQLYCTYNGHNAGKNCNEVVNMALKIYQHPEIGREDLLMAYELTDEQIGQLINANPSLNDMNF